MAITLSITPTRFLASGGKLDCHKNYIRKTASAPTFKFVISQNMDVKGGGLRYIEPDGTKVTDGSYTGTFSGTVGIGIKV
jgi:hypothetical protein